MTRNPRERPRTSGLAPVLAATTLFLAQCSHDAAAAQGDIDPRSIYDVVRSDLNITLTENGTVVAKDSQKLTFKIRGEGRITFLVPEGTEVAQDEVVCRLDTTELQKRVEEYEMQLLTAETELSTNRTNLEIQQAENIAVIEKAENAVTKAKKELERYRDGDAPQEMRKLKVELKDAETTFNRAQKKYLDSQDLVKLNYIKQTELEDHRIEFEKATVNKEGATLAIELFEKYTLPMTMTERQIAAHDSERELETARKKCQSELLQKQVAVTQSEKKVERLKSNIAEKKEDIVNMELTAPCPGFVLYGDPREPWYNERIKIGGTVWEGTTLMTIPDLRVMLVKLEVHEADINKLKGGEAATITMDSYPGLVLEGKVTKVAQIAAAAPPWQSGSEVKKFDVEITIASASAGTGDGAEAGETKIKPGISAKATIQIDRRESVLFVPLQCVFIENGKYFCRVLENGKPVQREIEVGKSSDKHWEITAGIAEGDAVLLYNPDLPAEPGAGDGEAAPRAADEEEVPAVGAEVSSSNASAN